MVAEDWESLKALMEADGAERKIIADDNRGIGDGGWRTRRSRAELTMEWCKR